MALIEAMFRMSASFLTGVDWALMSLTTASTAFRMPRASDIASAPAVRFR